MKTNSKYSKVAWLAAVAAMAVGYNATANTIQMDVSTIIDGSFVSGDGSSKPYLTGVFTDVSGGVQMTLSAQGLGYAGSGNYEHVLAWLFNVDSSQIGHLTFTKTGTVGSFTDPTISQGSGAYASKGLVSGDTQNFDIKLAFLEDDHATAGTVEFGNNALEGSGGPADSITFLITSSVSGFTADSFDIAATGGSANLLTAASVDDASKNLWVATTTTSTTAVPDAGRSATLLGVSLLAMGGLKRKLQRA